MPLFLYVALDKFGRTERGKMTAANESDLEERLKGMELDLINSKLASKSIFSIKPKISQRDMIIMCVHLSQLEKAGVPILESIEDLRDTTESKTLKDIMTEVYEDIKSGMVLSEALSRHPRSFDPVFTGIIAAGEQTGELAEVFLHLVKHMKWSSDIRRKVVKALMYPIGLLLVMSMVVTVMMMVVVPKFVEFLTRQQVELPGYTKALIATSNFFVNNWLFIIISPFILFITLKLVVKTIPAVRYRCDVLKLKLPMIGQVLRKIDLARFCGFFSLTFTSGLGILECLKISENAVQNQSIQKAIKDVYSDVSEGSALFEALRKSGQFPSLVLRMFKIGEDSGNFNDALENINYFYDKEVDDSVELLVSLIKPTLTIVLAALLFWIISAVFGPLYSNFENIV